MTTAQPIPCIGSVLWDIIGRYPRAMRSGDDRPGTINRLPGGVAMNVAQTLVRFGRLPTVLTCIGTDAEGAELIAACAALGVDTSCALRRDDLPTDRYMAIEAANGLVAAIADAASLEAAGAAILAPLSDGRLGSETAPFTGPVVLDGNLSEGLLAEIAESPLLAQADLRIVPASPGKATRLAPLLALPNATFYLNLEEAALLAGVDFIAAPDAANFLVAGGSARVLVTDGDSVAADAAHSGTISAQPPVVEQRRVTGAGDTFMAAHIAAEAQGHSREFALEAALQAAATYVAGEDT
ncbi:PfkB family carbohydrate kinase [Meridianimarinicoccus aquatilis]|uniref:Kinase n=1 Tax=Meridianimarinicoccus aquatilis TaxID=2552766 RepID=A0A4R6AYZ0_9RHOB|nr:PfkB family carbohydrate kinase [Fluviibacterium aquatile]QIE41813.1 kinase [Rhodobacteraceae bacterium SC52]TDL89477.1 kinase [Fluviibacterium aquatile]